MELRVVRHTDRFDEACAFWGDLLGWPVTRQWDDHGRGRIFGYGDAGRVELIEADHTEAVAGVFLSIEVDDVVALHSQLSATVPVTQPLGDQPWGHRSFGVTDPAGITVVFFQWI